jgi:hypothetical protein
MSTVDSRRELLKQIKERKYLNRDFDGFYQDLRSHAQTYFPDKIKDLSENGVGGYHARGPGQKPCLLISAIPCADSAVIRWRPLSGYLIRGHSGKGWILILK